jgi:TatD DNase family protein
MELIDTHSHLSAPDFAADIEDVIKRAAGNSIKTIINIGAGYGIESAINAVALAEKFDSVKASVGVHPQNATEDPAKIADIKKLSINPKVVAIGETGLDYFRDWAPKESQIHWFRLQIELAKEVKKPLIIHSRNAGEDCFNLLKEMNASDVGGVFHCYGEDEKFAKRLEEINFLVSFPGTITFEKADALRAIVKSIPVEQMMLETDAPYMAPEPNRGKRCESSFMIHTAKMMADIKDMSLEELAAVTTKTAKTLFKI